jgi:hypothetical protein
MQDVKEELKKDKEVSKKKQNQAETLGAQFP